MLKEDMLLQIFNEGTGGNNNSKGQRVLSNDLVSSLDITTEDKLICVDGNVISEKLFNEYHTKIEIDTALRSIFSTSCSCADFETNEFKKENYCCKHLVATFYKALEELVVHPLLREDDIVKACIKRCDTNILSMLLGDEKHKSETKIEVYINKNQWTGNITAEFKIGLSSMSASNLYVLKDINHFLLAYYNKLPVNYSKNFTFNMENQKLSTKDKRLIGFIEMVKKMGDAQRNLNRGECQYIEGKIINIPKYSVREFFDVINKHRVYLNEGFFYRPVDTEILYEAPPLDFDLKIIKDNYVLKSSSGMPVSLGFKNDVFLYGSSIYIPDYEFCYKISPYLKVFNEAKVVTMPAVEEEKILRRLIPDLNGLSPNVVLSKSIHDKIIMAKSQFNFYFDQEGKVINLTLKVKYGTYEFNIFEDCVEKIIYRDSKKEAQIIGVLKSMSFEEIKNKFYFQKGEDYIFKFFKSDITRLQEIGDVYYSQNFKGIKSLGTKSISGDIKSGKYNYFEMDFKLGDINPLETKNILRAFRNNLKYYKLKSGEYLDLEELELNKFLKLLDVVSPNGTDNNHIEISKSKAVFLDSYLEDNKMRYIKGKKELKEVTTKLKNIGKLNFDVPLDLNGKLRKYQKIGYNWFKTLSYLGFGGILGDEMGLGKTLQAITFILSIKESKTLIVAPTSLIYNWISEFEKFAPGLNVAAVCGHKDSRDIIIKNIENYDVIITTYNLVKRDLDCYTGLEFDYCIIDEAQNIKNPNSQNAISVKEIVAKTKFALSGTPIENSLMDLWSIFDFIMPGYLYDEKRFSVRYHKKIKANPEVIEDLNRLIKPFILRRYKKDVLKELPDKIEKTLLVTLNEEQKKVYKTYANHAMELIKKKVRDEEFKNSKIEILSYITKLRQICLDPTVLMNDYSGGSAKIEALVEYINNCIEEGHRLIVFSQFTSVLKNIQKRFKVEKISFSYLDGAVPAQKRMNMVIDFNEGQNSVFLISLKAGGTGLNLTSADVVIHFDPWWNPAVEEQATDRAHRIGQKNVVSVIKIIAKGTIEEKILTLQKEKKKLAAELMGDEMSGGEGFKSMSEEDIFGLFEIKE
ncbi:MAG: SNF2 helicase associated domain-containing protein [Clostridium sp.]|uniref:DEAD/DEAH box helicase n=1 Tax=Clostridium sp. TaxID=1506 RepID=UPI003D6CFDDF